VKLGRITLIGPLPSSLFPLPSFNDSAIEFAKRIRGYWGVENKVHYVRDVTQGEDKSRIRTTPLPREVKK